MDKLGAELFQLMRVIYTDSILWLQNSILWLIDSILWLIDSIMWLIGSILWLIGSILWLLFLYSSAHNENSLIKRIIQLIVQAK